jgi:hypothetical protein
LKSDSKGNPLRLSASPAVHPSQYHKSKVLTAESAGQRGGGHHILCVSPRPLRFIFTSISNPGN